MSRLPVAILWACATGFVACGPRAEQAQPQTPENEAAVMTEIEVEDEAEPAAETTTTETTQGGEETAPEG